MAPTGYWARGKGLRLARQFLNVEFLVGVFEFETEQANDVDRALKARERGIRLLNSWRQGRSCRRLRQVRPLDHADQPSLRRADDRRPQVTLGQARGELRTQRHRAHR